MITRRSIFGLCLAPIAPSLPEPQSRITWAGVKAAMERATVARYEEAQNRAMHQAFMKSRGWMVTDLPDGYVRYEILTRGGSGGGTQETNPVT